MIEPLVPQLLVALDVDTVEDGRVLVDGLSGLVGGHKIGSQLFTSRGPGFVEELATQGHRVFLDLKFHDIPNTVAGAIRVATRLGAWMIDVHTSGGGAMMQAAVNAARDEAHKIGRPAPLIIGVTVLTSFDQPALADVGVSRDLSDQVKRLAELAQAAGLDGVVASPHEIEAIRNTCGPAFTVVTPGIRSGLDAPGDQRRTLSAAEALAAGASYLVVGRPIIAAADPRAAAERIARECGATAVR